MAAPGNANTITGIIKAVENNNPQPGQSYIFIDQALIDKDQYEGGTLGARGAMFPQARRITT